MWCFAPSAVLGFISSLLVGWQFFRPVLVTLLTMCLTEPKMVHMHSSVCLHTQGLYIVLVKFSCVFLFWTLLETHSSVFIQPWFLISVNKKGNICKRFWAVFVSHNHPGSLPETTPELRTEEFQIQGLAPHKHAWFISCLKTIVCVHCLPVSLHGSHILEYLLSWKYWK